jgi:hypothetical protein
MFTHLSTEKKHRAEENRLLSALPAEVFGDCCQTLSLSPCRSAGQSTKPIINWRTFFFPTQGIISLLNVMENGASAEIAVTGNEGLVGISLFMGGKSTTSRAVVQSAGHATVCGPTS